MAYTKGKNLRLKFNDKLLLYATECSLSITSDTEEIAHKDSDGKENLLGDYGYTLSTSALMGTMPTGMATTHIVSDVLIDAQLDKTEVEWEFTSGDVGTKIYSGVCFVTQSDINAANGSIANTSFSLVGSGEITRATVTA